jgi:hypothetical protein
MTLSRNQFWVLIMVRMIQCTGRDLQKSVLWIHCLSAPGRHNRGGRPAPVEWSWGIDGSLRLSKEPDTA